MMDNFTYRGQHLRKWVPLLALSLIGVLVLLVVISVMFRPHQIGPAERPWGQGYEGPQQTYMQPDHSYLYYWTMYHVLYRQPQPTYHIYTPPPGYAPTYRPWYGDNHPSSPRYIPPNQRPASSPTRTNGGFSPAAPVRSTSPSSPSRTSGGFSSQPSRPAPSSARPAPSPSRTNGGFSSRPSSPSRTSGGFSSRPKSGGS